MGSSTALAPLAPSQRLDNLDVLRGLALLGIALMNVEYFSASMLDVSDGIDPRARGLDWLADAFVYLFVRSKFWTLFSLLFGMGFAVMLERARAAGRGFAPLYLRRCIGLLAIGLAHYWLVWAGDILFSYALTALVLLALFRNTPVPRLWRWGVGIWTVLIGLLLAMSALMPLVDDAGGPAGMAAQAELRAAELAAYSHGSYAEATAVRMRYFLYSLGFNFVLVPLVLGMFLVGAWLVRSGAMAQPGRHRGLFVRLAWCGGIGGLALTVASLLVDADPGGTPTARSMLAGGLHMAGAPLMSLAYIALVVLALQHGVRWLGVLAPAGRMALTNYLGQSLVGTWLFYGYGLGLWGEVSRAWQVLGVVLVFALQLLLSRWWLARFRYGPLEWLWRAFTYWRWPTLRREPLAPA